MSEKVDQRSELWNAYCAAMAAADSAYADVVRLTHQHQRVEYGERRAAWARWQEAAAQEKEALLAYEQSGGEG